MFLVDELRQPSNTIACSYFLVTYSAYVLRISHVAPFFKEYVEAVLHHPACTMSGGCSSIHIASASTGSCASRSRSGDSNKSGG